MKKAVDHGRRSSSTIKQRSVHICQNVQDHYCKTSQYEIFSSRFYFFQNKLINRANTCSLNYF